MVPEAMLTPIIHYPEYHVSGGVTSRAFFTINVEMRTGSQPGVYCLRLCLVIVTVPKSFKHVQQQGSQGHAFAFGTYGFWQNMCVLVT